MLLNNGYRLGKLHKLTEAQIFFIYKFKEYKLKLFNNSLLPKNHLTIKTGDSINKMRDMVKLCSNYKP